MTRTFAMIWIVTLMGCDTPATTSPCNTVFEPKRFDTDAEAENYIKKVIPLGSTLECVDRVMSSPDMFQSKSSGNQVRVYREREVPRTPLSLGLNSRIIVVTHDGSKVKNVEVN